jgi:hypothetical protein
MQMTSQFAPPTDALQAARRRVLEWLQEPHRNPMFLQGHAHPAARKNHGRIVERFLSWATPAGFEFANHPIATMDGERWELRWTYRGSELVGFEQPAPAATVDEAKLLGAAALIQNDWCRERLL